ncbi:MAG: hypothetical protein WAW17_27940, partial [Rhodococcus sp. (in: high G+C Gram-positive bacteria)]|uniref:hypothetical protein n=1 Tax=Rhodococcus sp. TaxID=1831 RepID=UPI003BB0071C
SARCPSVWLNPTLEKSYSSTTTGHFAFMTLSAAHTNRCFQVKTLEHIRQFAYSRRVSPYALLGAAIAYRLAELPPNHQLPPLVGGHGSLNIMVGLVAESGGGKSAAKSAARELVGTSVFTTEPGSGESLAHLFMRREGNKPPVWERRSVLAWWDEITTLKGTSGRNGSTMLSKLCTAFVGEELGASHVDKAKSLPLGDHSYRLCVLAGVQQSQSHVLLAEKGQGLPQRFLWLPATDARMPERRPDDPGYLPGLGVLDARQDDPTLLGARVVVPVAGVAERAVDAEQLRKARGDISDSLDSHALFVQLKVAAGLSLLEPDVYEPRVSEETWALADHLMAVSRETRGLMVARLRENRRAEAVEAGEFEADRESGKTAALGRHDRLRNWVHRKLEAKGAMTLGDLKRSAQSIDRPYVAEAVASLVSDGLVSEVDGRYDRVLSPALAG